MKTSGTTNSLEHQFDSVKPQSSSFPLASSGTMIHHKVLVQKNRKYELIYRGYIGKPYGVSSGARIISPQTLLKKFDYVRDCLSLQLGLTVAQREVVLRLLRYWAYYGNVYPKEATVTNDPGCSKATYWRTVRLLRELNLIKVVNRYVIRPHAQISNRYLLTNLVKVIVLYLAGHIAHIWPGWLKPVIMMTWPELWASFVAAPSGNGL